MRRATRGFACSRSASTDNYPGRRSHSPSRRCSWAPRSLGPAVFSAATTAMEGGPPPRRSGHAHTSRWAQATLCSFILSARKHSLPMRARVYVCACVCVRRTRRR